MDRGPNYESIQLPASQLKTIFQIPLSTRTSIYASISTSPSKGSLPPDIFREIVEFLSPADILSFSLTSTYLRMLLMPALYETVTLKSSRNCRVTLSMLKDRKDICGYIKKLAVRPNYYLAWPRPDEQLSEDWVVSMIEYISKDLTTMHTFDWDGLELPKDSLWATLRVNVFTNVGTQPLDPLSSLFDFNDLSSFSLIVRHGLGGTELFPDLEDLPPRFWDMLLERCPDLQELAICSFSSSARVFDFDKVISGHWPKTAHPHPRYIRFLWNFKRWMSPDAITMGLAPYALPALDTFIGVYQQLADLPHPLAVETLDLTCEPVYESRLTTVCPILLRLENLTSLDIWIHVFDTSRDQSYFFYSILVSCPKLTDFHFMCTTSFTVKPLKQLISQLYLLPHLKRFSLTKGHKYIDESMLSTALRILKYNPGLKQINIRWARERCPNHLKQEGAYDVVPDKQGRPEALMVVERGIPLVGNPFLRKFRYGLYGGSGSGDGEEGGGGKRRGGMRKVGPRQAGFAPYYYLPCVATSRQCTIDGI
ncbi:hypothetical protein CPB84DRAFT_1816707 [Gymnopilus junonius]|uniref:F-box domain-containing protein n=1 Tax=Gymnopilus junonius TaxID=109634 RepID=A0A9P5TJX7_GYMJU|nr:hypothetical protein CPB84DRAFT_1816707 [Gymnopilus junonius]